MKASPRPEPPPTATPASLSDPVTMTEGQVAAELAAIEAERSDLRNTIAFIPEREKELLDAEAPDAEFIKLNLLQKRAERRFDKLEQRERLLLARGGALDAERRQAEWTQWLVRYRAAQIIFRSTYYAMVAALTAVHQVRAEAEAADFKEITPDLLSWQSALPWAPLLHQCMPDVVEQHEQSTLSAIAINRAPKPTKGPNVVPNLFTVRFNRFSIVQIGINQVGYQNGQEAGFPADQAWSIVSSGAAVFTPGQRLPPKPKKLVPIVETNDEPS